MDIKKIVRREQRVCDGFVARACGMIAGFTILVWLLNLLNVFIVHRETMLLCTIITVALMLFPFALFILQKFNHLKKINFKYFSLTFVLIATGVLYSFLTFHVIFMFLFPAIVFNIYGDKKLMRIVNIGTLLIMIISHIASVYLSVNSEDTFKELYTVLVYGLLPKIIIYFAFIYAFIFETDHNNNMLNKVYTYAKNMHDTQDEIVRAFAEMCESKSGQTGHHVKRVSEYVNIMAKKLKIPTEERDCLVIASMMHDVGKLNIPAEILDKPGKLTDEEYSIIKHHTQYGYDLLKNSPGRTMEIAADIALNHHERWDGLGYNGLVGDQISTYSQIMAIADVFDALVSKRSYKEKWKPDDAFNEIVSQKGNQFAPDMTDVFIECYPEFLKVIKKYSDD